MRSPISLDDPDGAYRRTSSRIYRILEDGYDLAVANQIIDMLDRDALVIDAAFFLLVFGQIESRLNAIAAARLDSERKREALRQQRFERRLALALPEAANAGLRQEITDWYSVRNDAAHRQDLTGSYVISEIFERAYQLDALLTARIDSPGLHGEGRL